MVGSQVEQVVVVEGGAVSGKAVLVDVWVCRWAIFGSGQNPEVAVAQEP
jgi:hypothetical protein